MSTGARPPAGAHRRGPSDLLGSVPGTVPAGPCSRFRSALLGGFPNGPHTGLRSALLGCFRSAPASGAARPGACPTVTGSASAGPCPQPDGNEGQRGSITVLMLGIIVAALALALALAAVGRASHAHAQAQGVADLAALAAARHLADATAPPCPVAQQVATAHGAQVTHCGSDGLMVQVEVVVATQPMPGWHTSARAGARAGPVGLDTAG